MELRNYIEKKMMVILLAMFTLMISMSSCQKDKTFDVDITRFEWNLQEINTGVETFKYKNQEYFRENAFVLEFNTDSTFTFNTSVNYAGGKFEIVTKGKIFITTYGESTAIGTVNTKELELNQNLINTFNEVTEYKVIGKTLMFKSPKGQVKLKKK